MVRFRIALPVCLVLLAAAAIAVGVTGQAGYSLSTAQDVDVPDRTLSFQGNEYDISHIARTQQDTLSVSTTAPSGADYVVRLYDGDNRIIDIKNGQPTVEFETDSLAPGSYSIVIAADGTFRAVHPLVIPAYDATVQAPTEDTEVPVGDPVTVSVDVSQLESGESIEAVEVAVGNREADHRITLDTNGSGTYTGTLSTDGLPAGDYQLYAVVRGPDTVQGQQELLGLSDSQTLTLAPESTPTTRSPTVTSTTQSPTTTSTTGGGVAPGGTGGGSQPTSTTTAETTQVPTETTTVVTRTTQTVTPPDEADTSTTSTRPENTESPTSDGVIDPNTAEPTSASTTPVTSQSAGGPFGAFPLIWILFGAALIGYRTISR